MYCILVLVSHARLRAPAWPADGDRGYSDAWRTTGIPSRGWAQRDPTKNGRSRKISGTRRNGSHKETCQPIHPARAQRTQQACDLFGIQDW